MITTKVDVMPRLRALACYMDVATDSKAPWLKIRKASSEGRSPNGPADEEGSGAGRSADEYQFAYPPSKNQRAHILGMEFRPMRILRSR
jgi:hypothetical protein